MPGTSRRLKIALVLVSVPLAAVLYFALARPVQVLPRMQPALPFEMVDQRGAPYRFPDQAGPINLYVVVAPWDTAALARVAPLVQGLQRELAAREWRDLVDIVWILADPDYRPGDGESWPVDAGRRTVPLLRASSLALRMAVGAGFGIYVGVPAGDGTPVVYEPAVALVDGNGWLRARHRVAALTEELLLRDVGLLVAEAQARGAGRALFEAAHLFLCFPR